MRTATSMTLVGLLTIFVGCDGAPDDPEPAERADGEPEAAVVDRAASASPDTTAEALWRFLQEEEYRESWELWPGTDRLYAGTEPHGMLLTTYVNEVGGRSLEPGGAELPSGTVIVKENYMPDSTFAAATVMYKVTGYNPDHRDWLFAKFDADGVVEAFGRIDGCQACHQQAENGYVYTPIGR